MAASFDRVKLQAPEQSLVQKTKAGPWVVGVGTINRKRQPKMTTDKNSKRARIKNCCEVKLRIVIVPYYKATSSFYSNYT